MKPAPISLASFPRIRIYLAACLAACLHACLKARLRTRLQAGPHVLALRALLLALLLGAQGAYAQSCTVSSTDLAFGVYNPQSASPTDSVATVTVTCSALVSLLVGYTVSISPGSGSYSARRMNLADGTASMNYQIYMDLTHTKVWGDGSSGTFTLNDGYLINVVVPIVKTYSAYGRAPALQNLKPGSYADVPMLTITY